MVKNGKTLYLHIGTPKTATTAIQFFCRDNQETLNSHGYIYPIFEWKYPNVLRTRNAHFLVGDTYLTQQERNPEEEAKIFQEAFRQIYEAFEQYDNVILSDESMWNHGFRIGGWDRIKEELDKNIFTVKVIVYLRRQDEFTYSWWNQVVKEGMKKTSVITWKEMLEKLPVVQLDYYEILEKIAAVVGKENITVRRFDRNSFVGQAIQADFADAIGLDISEGYQIESKVENVSLTKSSNEIKRLLNCLPGLDKKTNDLFREYLSEISMNPRDDRRYSMLSRQELREFMAKYEEGNRRIAEEYLKGEDKLFDDSYQVEETWTSGNPLMVEDTVTFFGMLTLSLLKKNEELERQISTLRYKLNHPFQTVGNRIKNSRKKVQ
ncbi:hypothetical protein E5329_04130 [Petralouisia muris]|uniref:Uncharacterized protein n=1 Tax=Petralouisia muris TaxID=3032872 RepID=A0AC61RZX3_9FIRM|nr:hypothetical protein [Petralouisia muris]TGY97569.1 hypothetical protein E5329_04130 [Petralouisia muris]